MSKKRHQSEKQPADVAIPSASESFEASSIASISSGWGYRQIGRVRYFFLVVCVFAQLATILISWPAWRVRGADELPNLPWLDWIPQAPCGELLIVSLIGVLISPRKIGMAAHLVLLAIAISMDQFRCQPQILAVTFLMAACVWNSVRQICVWFLVAIWFWAGLHKLLSSDWFAQESYYLLLWAGVDARALHFWFALFVGVSELALGVLAWYRPRIAAVGCVGLHLGIGFFLLAIRWNYSVLPWNFCTAIVGAWILWSCNSHTNSGVDSEAAARKRLPLPRAMFGKIAVVVLLLAPAGVYFGAVRHCFAHVLYSGNMPIALVTHHDGVEVLEAWQQLRFPFPNEPKTYRDCFNKISKVGEKLHIREPRMMLSDHYYLKGPDSGLIEISAERFYEDRAHEEIGFGIDDPQSVFRLERGNATLLKRSESEMIYAIKFDPDSFDPKLLTLLAGVPNLEEIQLANCILSDDDLKPIKGLKKLRGIGLNETAITDAGLRQMKDLPSLLVIQREGTLITGQGLREIGIPVDDSDGR